MENCLPSLIAHAENQAHRPVTFNTANQPALDVILGESVLLSRAVSIVTVAKPDGSTVELEEGDREITLDTVGRYHIQATDSDGQPFELTFVVCEQAAHDWIPATKNGNANDRRGILRSLSAYDGAFDGTKAYIVDGQINLTRYGG